MVDTFCPRCQSKDIKFVDYMGSRCVVCSSCGFDESDELEVYPEEKGMSKSKGSYTPYKTGGPHRTSKK